MKEPLGTPCEPLGTPCHRARIRVSRIVMLSIQNRSQQPQELVQDVVEVRYDDLGGHTAIKTGAIVGDAAFLIPCQPALSLIPSLQLTPLMAAVATVLASISRDLQCIQKQIFEFLVLSEYFGQWSPMVNVLASILVMRWVQEGQELTVANWRITVLIAIMIAQKVVDDIPVENRCFVAIWQATSGHDLERKTQQLTCKQINKLEVEFLQQLHYRVYVSAELFSQVYEQIMTLVPKEKYRSKKRGEPLQNGDAKKRKMANTIVNI